MELVILTRTIYGHRILLKIAISPIPRCKLKRHINWIDEVNVECNIQFKKKHAYED